MVKYKNPIKHNNLKKGITIVGIGVGLLSYAFVDDLFLISKNLDIFVSIYKEINLSYVDPVNTSKLMKTGIDAMLNELDPYTEYVQESEIEDFKLKFLDSEYDGIGAKIGSNNGQVYISDIFENCPAHKADIRVGDEILEINSVSLTGKTPDQASLMLKGPQKTPLKLLLKRVGVFKPIEKNLLRTDIKQGSVPYYGLLANNVGYIKLDKFQVNSSHDVAAALLDLQRDPLTGLVLDLRDNGGGIVTEAIKIVNLFVANNQVVALQKGRRPDQTTIYKTTVAPIEPNLPLVVLVNNNSASASEIVSGALQDLDRAIIIGQRSFGKGLVQQTISMPYNSMVKITIAKYYTPSGRCIQALDYTHRELDGNVLKFPDSLMKEYKTKAGRLVYDGNGIHPDILVKADEYHFITKMLVNKNLIFDFATKFRSENPTIQAAKDFKLNETTYNQFITYLHSKKYEYDTPVEASLLRLSKQAEAEGKLTEIKTEIETLKNKIRLSKKNDLNQFKDQIKQTLENEIVNRYYFERGRYEQSFQYDTELKESLRILSDKAVLTSILQGVGNYKMIGKPVKEDAEKP